MPSLPRTHAQPDTAALSIDADCPRTFEVFAESHYCLALDDLGITFEVDRLRRERHELHAELTVRCNMHGARTVDGVLSVADLNLSSVRARQDRARYLGQRAHAGDIDWTGLLEELAQRVLTAERAGQPSLDLRSVPKPPPDASLDVLGLPILRRHPMIVFGDGGTAKSYLALFVAGELSRAGLRVGLFDWELDAPDHRERLEALYGPVMPEIRYRRCDRPLAHMRDTLQAMVREDRLDYGIFDSVAFACDTKPEDAEAAQRYFQAVRALGIGSLHIAHVNKGETGDSKPFGSAFWHNGARATWYIKSADSEPGTDGRQVLGLWNRKANTAAKLPPRGVQVTFGERTTFRSVDPRDVAELAVTLPASQRLKAALRAGALSRQALAEELDDVSAGTLQKTLKRALDRGQVVQFPGPDGQPRFGLRDREDRS